MRVSIFQGLYHDVATTGSLPPPTIVLACHTGMHDGTGTPGSPESDDPSLSLMHSWEPTVRLLASNPELPCVYTSYNEHEEMAGDVTKLRQWGAKVIVPPHRNPFRGLTPLSDVSSDDEFYYVNNFCVVTRGYEAPYMSSPSGSGLGSEAPVASPVVATAVASVSGAVSGVAGDSS